MRLANPLCLVYRAGEPPDERLRKTLLVPILVVIILASIATMLNGHYFSIVNGALGLAVFIPKFVYICATKRLSRLLTEVFIVSLIINIVLLGDFKTYGRLDLWTIGVPVMDLLLLCGCRKKVVDISRDVVAGYTVFLSVEQGYRLGVFDAMPQSSSVPLPPEGCSIPSSSVPLLLAVRLTAFISDFLMTRHFATTMRKEQTRIKSSVNLAQRVAESLVRFDLDAAQGVLDDEGGDVGEGLTDALYQLISNLRSYRPYLPDVVFDLEGGSGTVHPSSFVQPPTGRVTMVFTDIQSSTPLWESCPNGMKKAMATHNSIMSGAASRCNGYEVKTIGDAFMVAFSSPADACRFCLVVQEALYLSSEWCDDLLEHPLCEPVDGLWNGLRVRMGIHVGEMYMQVNPLTRRADYFGPNVNIAARMEAVVSGGLIAMTEDVHSEIADWKALGEPKVCERGDFALRGVKEKVRVFVIVPSLLKERLCSSGRSSPSVHSERTMSAGSPRRQELPNNVVRSLEGTVSHIKVDYSFLNRDPNCGPEIGTLVLACIDAVERTNGAILTVGSSSVVAGWNLGRQPVHGHATQAALSAGLLHRALEGMVRSGYVAVGISSGGMLHGRVGTDSRRFVIATGQCLEMAGELASAAMILETFALIGAEPGHSCLADDPAARRITRRVDTWLLPNGLSDVYELRVQWLWRWAKEFDCDSVDCDEWNWSAEFDSSLQRGHWSLLESLGDSVAATLASRKGVTLLSEAGIRSITCIAPQ